MVDLREGMLDAARIADQLDLADAEDCVGVRIAVLEGEAGTSNLDAHAQVRVLHAVVDPDDRCGKTRCGADAKRPARAERVGYPTDKRCADRCTADRCGQEGRHHHAHE